MSTQFQLVPHHEVRSSASSSLASKPDGELQVAIEGRKLGGRCSASVLRSLLVDSIMLLLPLYFIAYAIFIYKHDGQSAETSESRRLIQIAKAGPTIFSIVFAAVIGNFLKSIAAALLEAGSTIGTIEYLLSSRTVSAAATLPIRLHYFHPIVFLLVLLWGLSPLGGQSALRVVSEETTNLVSSSMIVYLDLNNSARGFQLGQGGAGASQVGLPVVTTFNAALIGPSRLINASQDLYGHLKVPMLETLARSQSPDTSGWYNISTTTNTTYSSLLGIPMSGLPLHGNSSFTIHSVYLYPNCTVRSIKYSSSRPNMTQLNQYSSGPANNVSTPYEMSASWHNTTRDTLELTLYSWSFVDYYTLTNATCEITQKFVELSVTCFSTVCNTTAIREVDMGPPSMPSILSSDVSGVQSPYYFFVGLLEATTSNPFHLHEVTSSPFVNYLVNPANPMAGISEEEQFDAYVVGDRLYSDRLAQLMNTFWLAGTATSAITGTLNTTVAVLNPASPDNAENGGREYFEEWDRYGITNTTAMTKMNEIVIRCNKLWLLILLICSLVMVLAAVSTAILNIARRGPDVLDAFTLAIRDNEYAQVATSSLEDGVDIAKRLKNVKVRVGDVQPLAEVGHVAIGIPTPSQPVKILRKGRLYN